jgi:fused signal recognition particle receptor
MNDQPEEKQSWWQRLSGGLKRTSASIGGAVADLVVKRRLDQEMLDEIEEVLIRADLGLDTAVKIAAAVGEGRYDKSITSDEVKAVVAAEVEKVLAPVAKPLNVDGEKPFVVLVVGVNGSGKTTTVGKLSRILVAEDRKVVLGAADTFRAAAVEQLATWGERVGVDVVRGPEGTDPASVAFDAVKEGVDTGADTVIVDTAGRLQNKAGLMDELGKVKRVIEKQAPVTEVLLVLDATTGQNGMIQARVFSEVVDVTGIVLTKLDGSAKGGIVVAVQRELGVPVKLVGLGEGADDLAPFDAGAFVDALLG